MNKNKKNTDCPYCDTDIGKFNSENLDKYANHLFDNHRKEVIELLKTWVFCDWYTKSKGGKKKCLT